MDELPSSLSSLLEEARSAHDPSAEDARRVARALSVAIPGFAVSALGASSGLAGVDASAQAAAQAASTVSQSAVASKGVFAGLASMKWLGLLIVVGGLGTMATVRDRPSEHAEAKPHGAEQTLALDQNTAHTESATKRSGASASAGEPGPQAAPAATPVMGYASNEAADTQEHASSSRPVPTRDDGSVPGVPPQGAEPSRRTLTILSKAARTRKPASSASSESATHTAERSAVASPARGPSGQAEPIAEAPADMVTADELALIRQAAEALRHEQPARALQLLEQHAARFPRGALLQERVGMVVVALCQQGRFSEAEPLREHFLENAPKSPLAGRIVRACAGP